jgi:hypothetical protein
MPINKADWDSPNDSQFANASSATAFVFWNVVRIREPGYLLVLSLFLRCRYGISTGQGDDEGFPSTAFQYPSIFSDR